MLPTLSMKQPIHNNLPVFVAKLMTKAPFKLQSLVMETVLQQVFTEALKDGDLDFLENHIIKVSINDINSNWYLTCRNKQIKLLQHSQACTTIHGKLEEFVRLVARQEDPDTLFFQRRLVIEGNTEIGLEMKNLLDSLDLESLPLPVRKSIDLAERMFVRK